MKLKLSTLSLLSLSLISGLFFPVSILAAGDYPTCAPNTLCTVGEFLYDDEYAPIATADCRLTARKPNGDLFINSAVMPASADGWYSINVATASAVGVYRSQVCCTAGADYLCLDKTFEVVATASALTAADVWDFSGRSLDDYGTLISDIWNNGTRTLSSYGDIASDVWGYSSRSLNSFGTLIAGIWDYGTRTITGGGDTVTNNTTNNTTNNNSGTVNQTNAGAVTNNYTSNVTNNQISNLTALTTENRQLLEQLVNKPVIKTFVDDGAVDLQSKLEKTKTTANRLYSSVASLKSRAELLDLKWSELALGEIESELKTISSILKEDSLAENSSLIASTTWLKAAWNDSLITLSIADQAQAAQGKIENLIGDLSLFGKTNSSLTFKSALAHIQRLDILIGTSLSPTSDTSLFGYLKRIEQLAGELNREAQTITGALDKFDLLSSSEQINLITEHTAKVLANNQIPNAQVLINPAVKTADKENKNRILALLGLVKINLSWLGSDNRKAINSLWLEEGSIVFRAVVSNPSKLISQKVPIEIYLPEEVAKEQIIQASPGLTVEFNPGDNRMWAVGEIELSPQETATFFVEVEDTWKYAPEEVDSLKKQVDDLAGTLKNTPFFAQATSLHSDIDVALDKIMLRQKEAVTPESRIKTYRESRLDMVGISQKIDALKSLVSQASATGSIFGFVGGVQAVAVWGLIIILIAGFVFLTGYMRAMYQEQHRFASSTILPSLPRHELPPPAVIQKQNIRKTSLSRARRLTNVGLIFLLTGSFASLGTSIILSAAKKNNLAGLISPLVTEGLVLGNSNPKAGQEVK